MRLVLLVFYLDHITHSEFNCQAVRSNALSMSLYGWNEYGTSVFAKFSIKSVAMAYLPIDEIVGKVAKRQREFAIIALL